jgi:hypothetical protein
VSSVSFTATAHFSRRETEPSAPLLHPALALHLKLLNLKTLHHVLQRCSWLSQSLPRRPALLSSLVDASLALASSSSSDPVAKQTSSSSAGGPLVLESKHPYDDYLNEYHSVKIPGAAQLQIRFDEQTRTEGEADYVKFFKGDSHSEYWGQSRYSGRPHGNWPGKRNNPEPLIIHADSFVLWWKTDSSVTDWGWKMTVTPVFPVGHSSNVDGKVRACDLT